MTIDQAVPIASGACLGIGFLAKGWPKFPNAYIPTLVAATGALLVPALCGWTTLHAVSGFIAGISATGIHQGARQVGRDVKRRTGNTEVITKP
jgi:hypothetical protein